MKKIILVSLIMVLFGLFGCKFNLAGDDGSNNIAVTGVILEEEALYLALGDSVSLVAAVHPENATIKGVSWLSDNSSVVTVDEDGFIEAVGEGQAEITVVTADGDFSDSCTVTVVADYIEVTGVNLDYENVYLVIDDTRQLTVVFDPINPTNQNVIWSSDNETVATVDQNGNVTAIAAGSATIMVETKNGNHKDTCEVTVTAESVPVTGISMDIDELSIFVGDSYKLTVAVEPYNSTNPDVIWSSDNETLATVDQNGNVTAVAAGLATITVETEDGGFTASCEVTAHPVPVTGIRLDRDFLNLLVYGTEQLSATIEPENATNQNVIWSSDNEDAVTVDQEGNLNAVSEGTAIVMVTSDDNASISDSCTVTVTRIPVTGVELGNERLVIHYGSDDQLIVEVFPSNATYPDLAWTSDNEDAVIVDETGRLTAVGDGTANITVTTDDGAYTDVCEIIACDVTSFVTQWDMSLTTTNTLEFPLDAGGSYNFSISWGDGTAETVNSASAIHDYSSDGVYTVIITGTCEGFGFSHTNEPDKDAIIDVIQWGSVLIHNNGYQFSGCENLVVFTAEDVPDLSGITNMSNMFSLSTSFNGDLSGWDTSDVEIMSYMFYRATSFNGTISGWDTHNVTTMNNMFYAADTFNGNITAWETGNVQNMGYMFYSADSFDGDLSEWDTSSVTTMDSMFYAAKAFNGDIAAWETGNVHNMSNMFREADSFNCDLSNWDSSSVTTMARMFYFAFDYDNGGNPAGLENWTIQTGCITTSMFMACAIAAEDFPDWY